MTQSVKQRRTIIKPKYLQQPAHQEAFAAAPTPVEDVSEVTFAHIYVELARLEHAPERPGDSFDLPLKSWLGLLFLYFVLLGGIRLLDLWLAGLGLLFG